MGLVRNGMLVFLASVLFTTGSSVEAVAAGPFQDPVVVGYKAFEPSIEIAPDGTVYIAGPEGVLSNGISSPSTVFRSPDAGASWVATPPGMRGFWPGGGDAALAIAPNGSLAMADLWAGSSTAGRSGDRADSWIALPIAGLPIQDRPWLASTGTSTYLAYHQIPSGIAVSKSIDGGLTYPLTTVAATAIDQSGCVTCSAGSVIASDGGGPLTDKVGVIFNAANGGVGFSRSTDGGITWSVKTIAASGNSDNTLVFPTVADSGDGRLIAVWLRVAAGRSAVQTAVSADWGQTWSEPKTVVGNGTSVYPWVAAKGDKVAISLYWNNTDGTADGTAPGVPWYESYLESDDFAASFGPLQTADPTAVKTGPICTGGTSCQANRELGDFQSVAIDNAGRANLAYNRSIDNGANVEVRFTRQS
ncbi:MULTISPECIES: sialidase family protein [unclassified Nocardia]|uniref:sialidase family protein n=1 Tax=unclassified Nocardia TaxID=2637762 RepID=UPI001CE4B63C|nr:MULTISPECIES: sialidase family protein [unclassified Nocardia]